VFCAELFAEELLNIDPVGMGKQSKKESIPCLQGTGTPDDEALLVDVALVDAALVDPRTIELVEFN
jgi:hypothetical protein